MTSPAETTTEPTTQEPVTTPSTTETGGGQETGLSDLGSGFLKDVSELERPIVEKYVKDWDAQVTKRFQDVHSEYADFKPFKEAGYNPDQLAEAVSLVEALNTNPQELLPALAEAYGVKYAQEVATELAKTEQGEPAGTQQQQATSNTEDPQLREMVNTMAQILLGQQQEQEQKQAEAQLDSEVAALTKKYEKNGPFDPNYVFTQCLSRGIPLEQAVQEFYSFRDGLLTKSNAPGSEAPVVLGASGGLPAEGTNLGSMDSKATKQLVTQILNNAKQERG